ncbi:MAG TPA: Fic family protein, partial [Duganella sp.]
SVIDVATLVAADRRRLLGSPKAGSAAFRLFELLPTMPRFTVDKARQQLETSFPTANAAVRLLEELGIVMEMTGQRKNRTFSYQSYIDLLARAA